MDNVKFEKMYAELVARGVNPREFADWLDNFNQRRPYQPVAFEMKPLSKMLFVYRKTESADLLAKKELCGIRLAKKLVLSTNMQLDGCTLQEARAFARQNKQSLLDYDELMLTVSVLPAVNKALKASGLQPILLTRPFWCRKKRQTVLIDLCNGRYSMENPENGGVLLKIV